MNALIVLSAPAPHVQGNYSDCIPSIARMVVIVAAIPAQMRTYTLYVYPSTENYIFACILIQRVSPSEKGVSRSEKVVSPSEKGVSPSEKGVSRSEKGVSRSEKVVSPSEKGVSRSEKVVSPSEKVVSRSEKVVSPSEKVVSPSEKVMSPSENVVSPSEKVVSPYKIGVSPCVHLKTAEEWQTLLTICKTLCQSCVIYYLVRLAHNKFTNYYLSRFIGIEYAIISFLVGPAMVGWIFHKIRIVTKIN